MYLHKYLNISASDDAAASSLLRSLSLIFQTSNSSSYPYPYTFAYPKNPRDLETIRVGIDCTNEHNGHQFKRPFRTHIQSEKTLTSSSQCSSMIGQDISYPLQFSASTTL